MSALLNQYGVEQQKLAARQAESNRALDLAFEKSIADVPAAKRGAIETVSSGRSCYPSC
jgi:hypothetical protein